MKKNSIIKKIISSVSLFALVLGSFSLAFTPTAYADAPNWNTTGDYVVNMQFEGSDYFHDMSLTQDSVGALSGDGGSPVGANVYTWAITSGLVDGDAINITANYTATPDAVTPQTVLTLSGVIAPDGSMSGTWADNYQGGTRTGAFMTTSGHAVAYPENSPYVVTNMATNITSTDATLNGTNGASVATGHSFWASLSPFATTSTTMPTGVYSTIDLGALSANATFSALLSSVVGLPAITADTPYYFVAWSNVDGTWYPGDVKTFTTSTTITDGTIGGEVTGGATTGTLSVTSIETVDSTGTADGTFGNGWKYVFNVTLPSNEAHLSMKFSDWMLTGGSSTMPVANNMRISSAQANNSNATVLITAANSYSTPTLNMVTDLNPTLDGIQVKVLVETAIPVNSVNGSYTTSYGVKTN